MNHLPNNLSQVMDKMLSHWGSLFYLFDIDDSWMEISYPLPKPVQGGYVSPCAILENGNRIKYVDGDLSLAYQPYGQKTFLGTNVLNLSPKQVKVARKLSKYLSVYQSTFLGSRVRK